MGWTDPSDSEMFEIKKHLGALCLIAVNEYLPSFTTSAGTSPAIKAEVAVIDGPGAGARYPDAMFFGRKIVPQMKGSVGSTILARIAQGQAQPGKGAPWQLDKAGPGDAEKANAYVKQHGDVEARPTTTDVSMASPAGYAPDTNQWASQRAQSQPSAPPQGLPQPPPYPQGGPSTFTQPAAVGAQGEEPPF